MPKMKVRTPSKRNKKKFEEASKMAARATAGEKDFISKISTTARAANESDRRRSKEMFESIPKAELDMMRMPESFKCGGAVHKMKNGGAVKKTAKRSVDGCAIRGKTRAVRNV